MKRNTDRADAHLHANRDLTPYARPNKHDLLELPRPGAKLHIMTRTTTTTTSTSTTTDTDKLPTTTYRQPPNLTSSTLTLPFYKHRGNTTTTDPPDDPTSNPTLDTHTAPLLPNDTRRPILTSNEQEGRNDSMGRLATADETHPANATV